MRYLDFVKIAKFGFRVKDSKIWIWARVKDFKFENFVKFMIFIKIKNLTQNQKSVTVVYHNFDISSKFAIQNFSKFVPVWGNKRHKILSKILKSIWTKICKNHQNFHKIGSNYQNFVRKILKTCQSQNVGGEEISGLFLFFLSSLAKTFHWEEEGRPEMPKFSTNFAKICNSLPCFEVFELIKNDTGTANAAGEILATTRSRKVWLASKSEISSAVGNSKTSERRWLSPQCSASKSRQSPPPPPSETWPPLQNRKGDDWN